MRRLLLFMFAICFSTGISAQNLPSSVQLGRPTGFVNDFAGVMTRQDREAAESLATAIRERTGAELVIVTVESFGSGFISIDEFSLALAESWGIGRRGEDTGVLLVLALTEREVKIEVGYGLEGVIPDSAAGRILDTVIIPAFRQDDFSGGLLRGLQAIAALVAREYGLDLDELDLSAAASPAQDIPPVSILIPFIFFIIIISLSSRSRRFRRGVIITSFGMGRGFGSTRHLGSSHLGGGNNRPQSFGGFGGGGFGGGGASRKF